MGPMVRHACYLMAKEWPNSRNWCIDFNQILLNDKTEFYRWLCTGAKCAIYDCLVLLHCYFQKFEAKTKVVETRF